MGKKLGRDAKIYFNEGSYAVPTWTEVKCLRDVTPDFPHTEADASDRSSATKEYLPGMVDLSLVGQIIHNVGTDDFDAILAAKLAKTGIDMVMLDGDITTSGAAGYRATFGVFGFNMNEPLDDTLTSDITLKPLAGATNKPEWYTSTGDTIVLTFDQTLVAGSVTLDLTEIPYGSGTYDGTGKIVTGVKVTNTDTNILTFADGAATPYELLGFDGVHFVPAQGTFKAAGAGGVAISGTLKHVDLSGVAEGVSNWELTLTTP